ncbi:MAG: hypothetical protein KF819_38180 [Labilithrix sp.]|nr:hypothetical protein [Labilithrix sp.]
MVLSLLAVSALAVIAGEEPPETEEPADTEDAPPRVQEEEEQIRLPAAGHAPLGSTGLQVAIRTGVSFPVGDISRGPTRALADRFAARVPIVVDFGVKPIPELFVGGYGGVAWGAGAASCGGCAAWGFRIGLEAIVYLLPRSRVNPWLGYGVGYDSSFLRAGGVTQSVSGIDFANVTLGMDVRVSRAVGLGPYFEAALGSFGSQSFSERGSAVRDGDIAERAVHGWLSVGARLVFEP